MHGLYESFIFEDYTFDQNSKTLLARYSLDGKIFFTEEITFLFHFAPNIPQEALERAMFGFFIMAGIGYYKTYIPDKIVIKKGKLSKNQAEFFENVYFNGLGQFFYENGLEPKRLQFPFESGYAPEPVELPGLKGSLVPVGGGKDSLTTVEILKSQREDFETWNVGTYPFFALMVEKIGKSHLVTKRVLSQNIFELNTQGALNGHVPITAIESFLAVCVALLRGKESVLFSIESSSDEENVVYKKMKVNHQYSKTLEFEKLFQEYLRDNISPSLKYFSFLRPLTELRIAQVFCGNFFDSYGGSFSSCNMNFRQGSSHESFFWCGNCPKCAFIFLIFSPFMPKDRLLGLFSGENLFIKESLQKTYRGLFGLEGIKPLECVGEIMEARKAAWLAGNTGNYPELERFDFPEPEYDYAGFRPHAMPQKFEAVLRAFLATQQN